MFESAVKSLCISMGIAASVCVVYIMAKALKIETG